MTSDSSADKIDVSSAESSSAPDVATDSSPVADGAQGSALDAVTAALGAEAEPESPTGVEPDHAESADEPAAEAQPEPESEFSDEDLGLVEAKEPSEPEADPNENLPFHKHPRWQEVQQELKAKRADAEQFQQIRNFMDKMALSEVEVANSMVLAGKLKAALEGRNGVDPESVLQEVDGLRQKLLLRMGRAELPAELREQVDNGEIDEATARRLVTAEAQAEEARRRETLEQERRVQEAQARKVQELQSLANQFESALKKRDPDYDLKAGLVRDQVRLHVATKGLPQTRDDALAMFRQAYQAAHNQVRQLTPRAPMKPTGATSRDSRAAETTVGPPKSPLEAVERALASGE